SGAEMVRRPGRRDGDRNEQNREQSCGRELEWVARYYSPASPPTKTSITRTGLSSQIQSSRHSGNSVLCPRSIPSTKRFIRSLRKSRRNHTVRITSNGAFLHSQGHERRGLLWPIAMA